MRPDDFGPRRGSERMGWFDWLSRWFGEGKAAAPPVARGIPRGPREKASKSASGPSATRPAVGGEQCPNLPPAFAPFAVALGLEGQGERALTDAEQSDVERLAAMVKAHFAAERDSLEMLPSASLRILNLVARPDVEFAELTSAASQDPAISAAVLRVANSASNGAVSREVRTVREAVSRLGVVEVGRVAGAVSARALFSSKAKAEQAMFARRRSDLHLQAVTTAAGAAHLAMERPYGRSDLAYLGGILHDVGKSVALGSLSALVVAGRAPRELPPAVLAAVLEQVHTEIGTEALRHWSLPGYLVTLCATHHDRELGSGSDFAEVHLVRVVAGLLAVRANPADASQAELLLQSLQTMGIEPLELRAVDAHVRALGQQMSQLLGLGSAQSQNGRRAKATA
jgi:HD-like signal output (HDOD) protein